MKLGAPVRGVLYLSRWVASYTIFFNFFRLCNGIFIEKHWLKLYLESKILLEYIYILDISGALSMSANMHLSYPIASQAIEAL